jgi:gas vesicle protein
MEEKTNAKGFMLGLLAGSIIGGLMALLYAPKSGKDLRKDITKKRKELTKDAEHYLGSAKHKAAEIISDGRKKAEDLISEAKKKAGSLSNGAEKLYAQGKTLVSEETAKLKGAVKAGVDSFREERSNK